MCKQLFMSLACPILMLAISCQVETVERDQGGYLSRETIVKAVSSWVSPEVPIYMGVRPQDMHACAAELLTRDANPERIRPPGLARRPLINITDLGDTPGMIHISIFSLAYLEHEHTKPRLMRR